MCVSQRPAFMTQAGYQDDQGFLGLTVKMIPLFALQEFASVAFSLRLRLKNPPGIVTNSPPKNKPVSSAAPSTNRFHQAPQSASPPQQVHATSRPTRRNQEGEDGLDVTTCRLRCGNSIGAAGGPGAESPSRGTRL